MKNFTSVKEKKQNLTLQEQKLIAQVATKLCPPFSKTYMAEEIFGITKQHLDWIINRVGGQK